MRALALLFFYGYVGTLILAGAWGFCAARVDSREIFTERIFSRLFLGIMLLGVVARGLSLLVDGPPRAVFDFFGAYELVGVVLIFCVTSPKTSLKAS